MPLKQRSITAWRVNHLTHPNPSPLPSLPFSLVLPFPISLHPLLPALRHRHPLPFTTLPKPTDQVHQTLIPLLSLIFPALLASLLQNLRIPAPAEFTPEGPQPAGLVLLDIQQFLTRRVPQRRVARVLGRLVDGHRGRGAVGVGAAVGEGDELGEGVGALGAAEEGGVAVLMVEVGGEGGGERAAEEEGR